MGGIFVSECKHSFAIPQKAYASAKDPDQTGDYSKTCVKRPFSKGPIIGCQDQLHVSLNAGQKYCRMLQREHSAILSTFIKLPVVIKTCVSSIFEWLFYTGFTVYPFQKIQCLILAIVLNFVQSRKWFVAMGYDKSLLQYASKSLLQ